VVLTGRSVLGLAVGLAALLSGVTRPSEAQPGRATIRGHVAFTPADPVVRRPSASETSDPLQRDPSAGRRAVVYFETAPRGAFEDREGARATLDQRNERFVPHVVAITVGTTVDFPNNDRTYHNVFSLSKTKRFDLGRYASGRSKAVRFDRPGIVRVFCDIHSHMNAFILVFAHRYFGVTDAAGRYQIDGVPPGTYTLSAWFDGSVQDQRTVTVAADARGVEVNFGGAPTP
jgi:plastocyanin